MVTGSLHIKNATYYAVIGYYNKSGIRKQKWVSTGLKAKNNKKLANVKLEEIKKEYQDKLDKKEETESQRVLFCDYMIQWLEMVKHKVEIGTYAGYSRVIKGKVYTYFKEQQIKLIDLKAVDIQAFYKYLFDLGLKSNTVIHYHANINSALKYAVKIDLIPSNPADKIDKPKKQVVITSYYAIEELEVLFEKVHNTQIEIPVLIASHYGLRRSEVIGLKWNAVDFNKKEITIRHTVLQTNVDNKLQIVAKDKTKNKSSYRTLPLIPIIEEILLQEKERQCKNKKLYKSGYNMKYQEYICVNEIGNLISPEYVSHKFPEIIQKYELKHIRFHDLRHSCASLLLKNGASMKQIQEWLGHSNYNTTANTYTHLDPTANKASADIINITFSNSKQKKSLV